MELMILNDLPQMVIDDDTEQDMLLSAHPRCACAIEYIEKPSSAGRK